MSLLFGKQILYARHGKRKRVRGENLRANSEGSAFEHVWWAQWPNMRLWCAYEYWQVPDTNCRIHKGYVHSGLRGGRRGRGGTFWSIRANFWNLAANDSATCNLPFSFARTFSMLKTCARYYTANIDSFAWDLLLLRRIARRSAQTNTKWSSHSSKSTLLRDDECLD